MDVSIESQSVRLVSHFVEVVAFNQIVQGRTEHRLFVEQAHINPYVHLLL